MAVKPADENESLDDVCAQRVACPACGGRLIDIRGKLQCAACHRICETCCEGSQG